MMTAVQESAQIPQGLVFGNASKFGPKVEFSGTIWTVKKSGIDVPNTVDVIVGDMYKTSVPVPMGYTFQHDLDLVAIEDLLMDRKADVVMTFENGLYHVMLTTTPKNTYDMTPLRAQARVYRHEMPESAVIRYLNARWPAGEQD
jgi:hypothetical protein